MNKGIFSLFSPREYSNSGYNNDRSILNRILNPYPTKSSDVNFINAKHCVIYI